MSLFYLHQRLINGFTSFFRQKVVYQPRIVHSSYSSTLTKKFNFSGRVSNHIFQTVTATIINHDMDTNKPSPLKNDAEEDNAHDETTPATKEGGGDPGASRHGNFMNYYQFHSAEERVRQLPRAIVERCTNGDDRSSSRKYVALDVGCNAGDLTLELHKFLSAKQSPERNEISILGFDLDPVLIERAREKNDRPESVTFECLDFFSSGRKSVISSYLERHRVKRFDVAFCFSITMWIHLNHGDEGLESFLRDLCSCSNSVLIEPQPWRCYRNAARRLRRADLGEFSLLPELKYRGDMVENVEKILREKCGFKRVEVSEENDWQRRLVYYERGDIKS